jgi:phage baseplate assembly protein W
MNQQFYSLPLTFAGIMQKKDHPTCTLQQSVAQHLHLIITTAFGELPAEEKFGCSIWEHDFDNITSAHKIKEYIRESLQNSIEHYEKRLANVRIDLLISQEELINTNYGARVKKKITITITGLLQSTNERFVYEDSFFTGPLSYQLI